MEAESEDIAAVKEWLAAEVKLERYADKLVSNGFISLEICCNINETVLDEIGIVLPYHRRRFLTFVEKLKEKLGVNLPNEENGVMSNAELISRGSEAGNEQQTSLIHFADNEHENKEPESGASVTLTAKEDGKNSESIEEEVPVLPPKASKRTPSGKAPPPIPPRADLQEGTDPSDTSVKTVHQHTHTQDLVQPSQAEKPSVQPQLPKKKIPVKPPRRTIHKVPTENKPEATPSSSIQTGAQPDPQQQNPGAVSNDIIATFDPLKSEESLADVNSTSAISDLPKQQVVDEDLKTLGDHNIKGSAIYENIEDAASLPAAQIEAKRPVPKPPARAGSKQPVPANSDLPKPQVVDEDLKTSGDHDIKESATYGNIEDVASHPAAQIEANRPVPKAPARAGSKKPVPAISDLPKPQVVDEDLKTSGDHDIKESAIYGNIEDAASHPAAQIEAKRPVPKPPARAGSKKPVPVPRGRVKSEDGILVTALVSDRNTVDSEKGETETSSVLNHTLQPRTKSFSTPENKRILSTSEEKASTLPRYPARAAPPPPPPSYRQTGASLKEKKNFPEMPLPPIPSEDGSERHHDQSDGACKQGSVQGICSPDIKQPGPVGDYVLVQESTSDGDPSIYETIGTQNDQKVEVDEPGDVDYSSDDSLDGLVDLPDFSPKIRGDSVGSTDDNRMSRNILSSRVRKRDGFLWKQGGQQNNRGWRKRWFVFDGNELRYYKDKSNLNESLHIIPVSQIRDIEHIKDAKRPTFKVVTPNRTFILASESITEMNLWSQTLMEAVITYKGDNNAWKSGGDMCDPEKEGWLKKQGHNVVADWRKRYVAVKDDKICYYDTYEDFVYATPINCINAALAKVKTVEGHKNRFTIITFNKSYSFQGDSEIDSASWIIAIETAIQIGLGDRAVLEKVWENPSNRKCADCGIKDPVWASINFCVCICARCVGIHRHLGVHCSRARSLLMDERVWNPTLIELMVKIGNDKANQLLEHKLPEDDKITPQADFSARHEFIYSKYKEKKYCKYHQAFGDNNILGKCLRETVVTDDIVTTMALILNKVDVCFVLSDAEDEKTPLELAEEAGQALQAELLRQNGGEGGQLAMQINDDQDTSETSQSIPVVEVVYEKQGFLYKKEGSWRKRWFLLKDRDLKYARGPHEKEDLVTIDLRTVTSLVKCPKGEMLQMDVVTVDKTHSLKADTEEELEAWYSALRSKQVFGVLLRKQELGSDGIPHLVAKCLQFVETYGGLEMEGVYRVNGAQLTMKKLRTSFDQDAGTVLLTVDECGVHDVTGVLKQYLRQLPDPVIPSNMYKLFIAAGLTQDHNTRLTAIKDLINQLPKVNHDTLKEIIFHLTKVVGFVAVNKMGVPNIAMIFGPTLMSNENTGRMDDASINQEFSIIGDMINYYQWLFDVDKEEFEKDKAIQVAKQKIRQLQELRGENSDSTGGEFTLDIYVEEKNDKPCRLKVSSEMTAGRVCAEIVAQMKLPRDTVWVLFEVIDNGAMERAFQVREKVLAAANWGSGNYLIVKENYIAEQIAPHVGGLSIEGTLYIREPKKSWKQSQVCLKNGYMSVNKERGLISKAIKSDKSEADQWPLHKLTLYVGVPSEKATKGVDTSCGFTVIVKTDQEDIMRYMCVKDKRDMNRWLAAILNMKHPEGIWSDPSQREAMAAYSVVEPKQGQQTEDLPLYLGRQSMILRRKGSSKHIMNELKVKQKSLRRSTPRDPQM